MLKIPVRSEVKEAIILLTFVSLMVETLTSITIGLVLVGAIMVWFHKKPNRMVRNIITLGLFAAYWITYGKVIDPEVGMNFLTSIVLLKLLEKETERDRFMIFFGIILLISAGSLFQRNLSYVFFFAFSFFILIQDFYKNLRINARMADLLKSLIWVLPLTAFLFFFVPRMINPFQLGKGASKEGELGYTPEVNISQLEKLSSNDSPVFQVSVEQEIPNADLYWRGNTLSFSDGWNWPLMPQDRFQRPFTTAESEMKYKENGIKQKIRVFSQEEFFFAHDHPLVFITPKGVVELNSTRSLSQHRWQPSLRYQVIGQSGGIASVEKTEYEHFKANLKPEERKWIHEHFREQSLPELQKEIETFFHAESFTYSLSPGKVENLLDFMINKKIGFCSHYASAVAQILRVKNIPARLVSGFLGGRYNKFASFYLITQNDAHVWIEAFHQGQWIRLDPTEWIAPDRIRLGSEAFMLQSNPETFSPLKVFGKRFAFFNDIQQWFAQWDFKFYQILEEMDFYGQEAFLDNIHFKREWIFSFIPLMLALFMGIYVWHLSRKRAKFTELESSWKKFQEKLKKRGLYLPLHSIDEGEAILRLQDLEIRTIWKELVEASFQNHNRVSLNDLKKKIRDL